MNADQDIEMSTDEALISALTPRKISGALGEIELQPFSAGRQFIASDLCYPTDGICNRIITVWICTLSPEEVLKARLNVETARREALAWAEAQGYSLLEYKPIAEAYARLNRELEASAQARLTEYSEDGKKKALGGQPHL